MVTRKSPFSKDLDSGRFSVSQNDDKEDGFPLRESGILSIVPPHPAVCNTDSRPTLSLATHKMASAQEVTVPFIKKKGRSRPTTTRQRSTSPGPSETSSATTTGPSKSEVVLPARKSTSRLISAGTKRTASKRDEDDGEEDERGGPDVKWTAEGSHINAAKEILLGDEADELLVKRRKGEKPDAEDDDVPDDGLYRGQKGYTNHIKKRQEVPKAMRVGPQRNTSTIRTVTIVDYQPDVCKDYKGACSHISLTEATMLT